MVACPHGILQALLPVTPLVLGISGITSFDASHFDRDKIDCCQHQGQEGLDTSAAMRRDTTMEFMKALPPVVDRILSLFARGIGFPETFFKDVRRTMLSCNLDINVN